MKDAFTTLGRAGLKIEYIKSTKTEGKNRYCSSLTRKATIPREPGLLEDDEVDKTEAHHRGGMNRGRDLTAT